MSIDTHWFSTLFDGMFSQSDCNRFFFHFTPYLKRLGYLESVNGHIHDLGNMFLHFLSLDLYVVFSIC